MRKHHRLLNIFWIGLSFFIMILSYKVGIGRMRSPGPGLMPFLLGLLLFPVSLYSLIRSFAQKDETTETAREDQNQVDLKKVVTVIMSLFVYAFVFEELGFLLATTLLLVILFGSGGGKKRWRVVAMASVLTGLITYFGFTYLGVQFPVGIFGF